MWQWPPLRADGEILAVHADAMHRSRIDPLPVRAVGVDDLEEVAHKLDYGRATLVDHPSSHARRICRRVPGSFADTGSSLSLR